MNTLATSIRASYRREREKYMKLKVLSGVLYPSWEKDVPGLSVPDDVKMLEEPIFFADFTFVIRARFVREHPDSTLLLVDHVDDDGIHVRFQLLNDKFSSEVEVLNTDLLLSWCIKKDERKV